MSVFTEQIIRGAFLLFYYKSFNNLVDFRIRSINNVEEKIPAYIIYVVNLSACTFSQREKKKKGCFEYGEKNRYD